jgi:hypothetical protein
MNIDTNNIPKGTYAEIIKNSLVGLKFTPTPFPDSIWNTEFDGVNKFFFVEAVKRIRKTQANFPTYSDVYDEINKITVEQAKKTIKYGLPDLTKKEVELSRKARAVFRKWYKWLNSHSKVTPKILEEYSDGCARDYSKIGLGREGMENVEILFKEADRQKAIQDEALK